MSMLVGKERLYSGDVEESDCRADVGIRHTAGEERKEVRD